MRMNIWHNEFLHDRSNVDLNHPQRNESNLQCIITSDSAPPDVPCKKQLQPDEQLNRTFLKIKYFSIYFSIITVICQ